jgi:twitching motility protein PilU
MDRDKAIRFMHDLLKTMLSKQGSDLFITVGASPSMKIDGKMTPITNQPLSPSHTQVLVRSIMNDKQAAEFEEHQEVNFAISLPGMARFRVNAFTQRGSQGMVLRTINSEIPTFEQLSLPNVLKDISMTKRGLVIFVGGTGSGKSTSLAAMVGYRNENSYGHIVTIEDPIEYMHDHKNCLITQREVGVDTESYEIALKNTLRQAPDVILLGEIRDRETMDYAIAFAETGHLCLSTLHANSTNQALDRIINFFPEDRRQQLLMDLSLNLKGVISQRLIPRADQKGRVPAVEVMINTPLMSDLIFKGEVHEMKGLMAKSNEQGMITFDQALFNLFEAGAITYEDALRNADSVNDLRLRVKLESKVAKSADLMDEVGHLQMEEEPDDSGMMR